MVKNKEKINTLQKLSIKAAIVGIVIILVYFYSSYKCSSNIIGLETTFGVIVQVILILISLILILLFLIYLFKILKLIFSGYLVFIVFILLLVILFYVSISLIISQGCL